MKVVDLVHSKNSKYLRMRIELHITMSMFRSVYKWGGGEGGKIIPFGSTLSFNVLERSSSFIS